LGTKIINFEATDNILLNGILATSDSNSEEVIISVHGMSSNCFKDRERIIAKYANESNIDYFAFNNRGSDLSRYIYNTKTQNKLLGGTSNEDVQDSYYDIKGAIQKMIELGYKKIHLQGHSLGCTKIVYTYQKFKENREEEILSKIYSVILLSLVDIYKVLKVFSNNMLDEFIAYAEEKESNEQLQTLMPKDAFIHPVSVKTYLRYAKYYQEIDFAQYSNDTYQYTELNSIQVPLFMRWGNVHELVEQDLQQLTCLLKSKLLNKNNDISYIDGADHGYTNKENILAEQIMNFIKKNK